MKGLKTTKRLIAAVLSLVMLLGVLPVIPLTVNAATASEEKYISLPITIRDYAGDGMLFEANELGDTGTATGGGGGVAPLANYSVVGSAETASLKGTTYGATITLKRTVAYDAGKEEGRYLKGTLNVHASKMRYIAFRYSQSAVQAYQCPWLKFYSGSTLVKEVPLHQVDGQAHNEVIDLGNLDLNITEVRYYTRGFNGVTANIYWMNAFATKGEAENYNASGGAYSKKFIHGNNLGFGMLATTNATHTNNMFRDLGATVQDIGKNVGIANSTFYRNGRWGSGAEHQPPSDMNIVLSSGAKQTLVGGVIRTDLVEDRLENGNIVYTQSAVDYIAQYLQTHLQTPWSNGNGTYNMWHIMGQKLSDLGGTDLATKLRAQISANGNAMGTYADAKDAFNNGQLNEYTDVDTYYKAAYFLLHSTFSDNVGYGKTVDCYKEIRLVEQVDSSGKSHYVFNSGYNDTAYDPELGVIYNTQTTTARYHQDNAANAKRLRGLPHYYYRFDPLNPKLIGDAGYGISGDTYRNAAGLAENDESLYYKDTNYHLSLEGHAQFVYYYDDDLYFTFTGDDDVYLFINGVRVMDMGGAHSISKVRVDINEVAKLCGLEDGKAYSFDFFYMERHGTAANFSIETNIQIVDPAMVTTKEAYQDSNVVGYNGFVDAKKPVEYLFGLENKGNIRIQNLTFTDNTISTVLTPDSIDLNSETTMADLSLELYNANGTLKLRDQDLTEDELKAYLAAGLEVGEKIRVGGFLYTIPSHEWNANGAFPNRVYTTSEAHFDNGSVETLHGVADWMVQKYDILFNSLHVYDWGKLKNGAFVEGSAAGVTLTKAELLSVAEDATDAFGNSLTTEDVPDYNYNVAGHKSAVYWNGTGYTHKVLQLTNYGTAIDLGNIDLSKYTAVKITYGSDGGAKLGDVGSEFCLTSNGAVQNGTGSAKSGVKYLARATLSNANGKGWSSGTRSVTLPLNTTYNGTVYLAMYMRDGNGTAVTAMTFVGKDGVEFTISPNATIKLCSPSGGYAGGLNKNATLNADQSVTYKSTATGASAYHYNIIDNGSTYGPVSVNVFTYGVADTAFVLDYGLPVKILGDEYDFTSDDVVDLGKANPYGTSYGLTNIGAKTNVYGDFTNTDDAITYTLNEKTFFNGTDTIELTLQVLEKGATEVTKTTGVTMTQTVTMVPANVMYYEDDFGSLDYNVTYVKNDFTEGVGNVWALYTGDFVGALQSPDQSLNYGYDPNYAVLGSEVLFFDPYYIKDAALSSQVQANLDRILNGSAEDWNSVNPDIPYPAGELLGDASNDTIHVMNVAHPTNSEIFSFEFTGDGFEIVSRTTYASYAVLTVKIEQRQEDGSYKTYKLIPVISESLGGDLSQIPLIARKDLPYGDYRVSVYTSNVRGEDRVVYIDGVRVFHPLTAEESALYYKADEANVTFDEIKTCIKDKNIVYGTISPSILTEDVVEYITQWAYGSTMIECQDGSFVLNGTDPYDETMTEYEQFMTYGPNNEIYLNTSNGARMSYIAFYVEEDPTYVGERSIQVGAHLKYTGDNLGVGDEFTDYSAVSMVYGGAAFDILSADSTYMYAVSSGTEQYFSIDTDCLTFQNANGVRKALVIIGTNDPNQNTLTLTNLKLNGYSIASGTGDEVEAIQDASDVLASKLVAETYNLYEHYVLTSYKLNKKD